MQAHLTAPSEPALAPDDEFLARFGDASDDRGRDQVHRGGPAMTMLDTADRAGCPGGAGTAGGRAARRTQSGRGDGGHAGQDQASGPVGMDGQADRLAWRPLARPVAGWRRARLIALVVGGFLVPWCVLLSMTLPATAQAQHWSLAWAGLDGAEALAALATAVLLTRADPRAALTAVAGGTLLLIDAWFDVCTSAAGLDRALAVAEAACAELPLAIAAYWLAVRLTRARP
jgi:hypothetical protein